MSNFFQMAGIQALLFIYMLIGYIARKTKILDANAIKSFTDFVIYFSLPAMIFQSFDLTLTAETLRDGFTVLLIATCTALFSFFLGKILYLRFPKNEKAIMQYGTLVSNSGFAGLPVVENAFGSGGLFLASLYIIPTRILMWSAGISVFTDTTPKERVKKVLLNPGIIAVFFGIARMLIQPSFPSQIETALNSLSTTATPLAMIVIGMILSDVPLKNTINRKTLFLVFIRQFALPLLQLIVLRILHVDQLSMSIAIILTGMPIGATTAILAAKYKGDEAFASKCVLVSTVSSLFTVPILTLFL